MEIWSGFRAGFFGPLLGPRPGFLLFSDVWLFSAGIEGCVWDVEFSVVRVLSGFCNGRADGWTVISGCVIGAFGKDVNMRFLNWERVSKILSIWLSVVVGGLSGLGFSGNIRLQALLLERDRDDSLDSRCVGGIIRWTCRGA